MRNSPPLTSRRLALLGLLLAFWSGPWWPTTAQAQEQPGANPILNPDRNRALGQPEPVIGSGGPSAEQVERLLQQRIQEQSEGQITLFGFRQIAVKALDLELNGKMACAVEFEAGIEFQAPGVWASGYHGRPLTFVLIKPFTDLQGADQWRPFRIEAKGERFVVRGYALLARDADGWSLAGFGQTSRPVRQSSVPDEASAECLNHLKQIGLAFRTWAIDHDDHFPFNVSTNAGGTLELCARGEDGFDAHSAAHFRAMSNELGTARFLVCPADSSKRPAASFANLQAANVSYLVRSGTNVDEARSDETLARCPVHGHVLLCDGSVKAGSAGQPAKAAPAPPGAER